jgi:hypothetical protein
MDKFCRAASPVGIALSAKHIRVHAVVLGVVDLEPKTLQPDEIMQGLPNDAADRHPRH